MDLPPEIAKEASFRGNEYGWPIPAFPDALIKARSLGFACLGGQFQFRFPDGTYEMYWLSANSSDRRDGESWSEYANRSCTEVMEKFSQLVPKADFVKEAARWHLDGGALEKLVFVAYFESELTFAEISATHNRQGER
jgi:hypothetical protein